MDQQDQQQLDAIARLHAERMELELDGYLLRKIGDNERQVLTVMATYSFLWGWLGTALAGATLGTLMLPLIGTVLGFLSAGIGGIVPCILTSLLYAISRGRISPKLTMAWGGAMTGVGCFAQLMPWPILLGFGAVAGVFGATGARLSTRRSLKRYQFEEGLGMRSYHQFSILDLMLLTVWLALFLTALQIVTRIAMAPWSTTLACLAISLACALAIETVAQLSGRRQSRRST